jgi:hypothetical protein
MTKKKKLKIAIIFFAINVVLFPVSSFFFSGRLTLVGFAFLFFGLLFLFSSREYKILRNRKKMRDLNEIYQERFSNGTFLGEMEDAKIISRQIDVLKREQKRLLEIQE